MTTPKPEATPEQVTDVRELIKSESSYGMALSSTDGDDPADFVMRDAGASIGRLCTALTAALEREEALRGLVLAMLDLIRDYTGDGRTNVAGLITWFEEWKESAEAALSEKANDPHHL